MSRTREFLESAVLVVAILVCAALWSRTGLQAKDGPKEKHKCPLCGNEEVTFENTPEGAFAKFRFATVSSDPDLLKECILDFSDQDAAVMLKEKTTAASVQVASVIPNSCKTDGDKATLQIEVRGEAKKELAFVRKDGVWKLDLTPARNSAKVRDCMNNLRQLGTYTVMYTGKYGSDRYWPGPGIKILTDLFNLPTKETAICAGNYGLLLCKASGETWDDAHEKALRGDDSACTSYKCIDQQLDETTQPHWPIAWDKKPHPDGTRNVLFFSGSVSALTEEQFQTALALWPKK